MVSYGLAGPYITIVSNCLCSTHVPYSTLLTSTTNNLLFTPLLCPQEVHYYSFSSLTYSTVSRSVPFSFTLTKTYSLITLSTHFLPPFFCLVTLSKASFLYFSALHYTCINNILHVQILGLGLVTRQTTNNERTL